MNRKTAIRTRIDRGAALVAVAAAATVGWSAASEQAHLEASVPSSGDNLGVSVAVSGNTLIAGAYQADIGANADQGAAYVFVRSGTTWSQEAILTATGGAAGDLFGVGVAIQGDTALVGALTDDVGANVNQGSAYVFTRSGTTWTQQAQLTASDGAADDLMGSSVAISGETVIVAALQHDVGGNADQGAAYVFTRTGTTWSEEAQLTSSTGAAGDNLGWGVSVSGDTAVAGGPGRDVGGNANQGSAFVFTRSGTVWTEQTELTASDGAAGDFFGANLSLFGGFVVIGARSADVGVNADQGAAYAFTGSGASWSQQQKLTAGDGAAGDNFGWTVSLFDDTALVGSYHADVGGNADQGAAYLFTGTAGTWTESQKLVAADGAAGDEFGSFVSISFDTAVVGAVLDDEATSEQGSVYVFAGFAPDNKVDSDRDGLPDAKEIDFRTNAASKDTDGDGVEDGVEVEWGSGATSSALPADKTDTDGDGIPDAIEISLAMNSGNADQDADGYKDGYEYAVNGRLQKNIRFGDTDRSGGRPNLADAQLLTRISLGLTSQGNVLDQDLDINRGGGPATRSDSTLLTYFAQGRVPRLPYP